MAPLQAHRRPYWQARDLRPTGETLWHLRNAFDRVAQFQFAADPRKCLAFARDVVAQKADNQRTFIRRNSPADAGSDRTLADTDCLIEQIPKPWRC